MFRLRNVFNKTSVYHACLLNRHDVWEDSIWFHIK